MTTSFWEVNWGVINHKKCSAYGLEQTSKPPMNHPCSLWFVVKTINHHLKNYWFDWGLKLLYFFSFPSFWWSLAISFLDYAVDRRELEIKRRYISSSGFNQIIHLINMLLKDNFKCLRFSEFQVVFLSACQCQTRYPHTIMNVITRLRG